MYWSLWHVHDMKAVLSRTANVIGYRPGRDVHAPHPVDQATNTPRLRNVWTGFVVIYAWSQPGSFFESAASRLQIQMKYICNSEATFQKHAIPFSLCHILTNIWAFSYPHCRIHIPPLLEYLSFFNKSEIFQIAVFPPAPILLKFLIWWCRTINLGCILSLPDLKRKVAFPSR